AHELHRFIPVMARARCCRVAPVPAHVRVKQPGDDIEVTGKRRLVTASSQIDVALGHALDCPTPTVKMSIGVPDDLRIPKLTGPREGILIERLVGAPHDLHVLLRHAYSRSPAALSAVSGGVKSCVRRISPSRRV